MITYKKNNKFRIKVTDRCNFSCPFCHAEGGRAAQDVAVGPDLIRAAEMLRPLYSRVHLTGGEPFLYEGLGEILDMLRNFGYQAAITTNGYFSFREKQKDIERMEYVNFSVHSFQEEYVSRLAGKKRSIKDVISVIRKNVMSCQELLPVRVNTVVSDDREGQRVEEIFEFCGRLGIELKLMPEWSVRKKALPIIQNLLKSNGFELFEKVYLWPGSNVRERYRNGQGQIVEVKNIEFYFPDFLCGNCTKKKECQEGFSFLRVGGNPLYVQPCIFNRPVNLDTFEKEILPEINSMFEKAAMG